MRGLIQNWIFNLIQLFFIFFFFSSSHVPLRFVTSHPARVTRVRQSSKKAGFILERKKPLFKPVKLIWSINIEVNKQIKTGIFARYSRLLKAFDIDFSMFQSDRHVVYSSLKEILYWIRLYDIGGQDEASHVFWPLQGRWLVPVLFALFGHIIPRTEQSRVQNGPPLTALFRYRWLSTVKTCE